MIGHVGVYTSVLSGQSDVGLVGVRNAIAAAVPGGGGGGGPPPALSNTVRLFPGPNNARFFPINSSRGFPRT